MSGVSTRSLVLPQKTPTPHDSHKICQSAHDKGKDGHTPYVFRYPGPGGLGSGFS